MSDKPISIAEFKCVDKAAEAFRRVAMTSHEASTRLLATMRHLAEEEDRDAGYALLEVVIVVVLVVLAFFGVLYLAAHN
jgi:hypothetical protein